MELSKKSISIAFVIILAITILVSLLGMLLMSHQPLVLQGQIETTEIRISGKLPGRVDSFLVREGDWVQAGDTLVVINSPTIEAKYRQVNALEQVAQEQNKKIDAGTRRQIIATAGQLWNQDLFQGIYFRYLASIVGLLMTTSVSPACTQSPSRTRNESTRPGSLPLIRISVVSICPWSTRG